MLYALGASAEYEALKKAVADANEKAAAEQVLHEKHEARVITSERELQEAVKKSESLEQSLVGKESELAQALQAAEDAQEKPEVLYGTFRRPGKLRLVRPVVYMAIIMR